VNPDAGEGSVDWPWLETRGATEERDGVRRLRFPERSLAVMNGKAREGMIFKAGSGAAVSSQTDLSGNRPLPNRDR
jgi:hypothetical protein